jgi:hypothetical protein
MHFKFLSIPKQGSVAITLEQAKHKEKESELNMEKRTLKVELKELELAHQETIKALQRVSYCINIYNA